MGHKPGVLYGKTAKECTRQEIAREVWAQMKAALNDTGHPVLKDRTLHRWHRDPAIQGTGTANPTNDEQLLVHPKGTWFNRPTARTRIPNLFLAGDYVQVPVDLATMEGANTSGKLAASALLDATESGAERAPVIPLYEAPELESFKKHDETRYRLGLPNTFDLG